MKKVKWYLTTGRESEEVISKITKITFSCGVVRSDYPRYSWLREGLRTKQRLLIEKVFDYDVVAYTLGETVESKQCQKS